MNKQYMERINQVPLCLVRASEDYSPNEDLVLLEEKDLLISVGSKKNESLQIQGDIILKLNPKPRLVINCNSDAKIFFEALNQNIIMTVSVDKLKMYGRVTRLDQKNFGKYSIILSSIDDKTHTKIRMA